MKKIFTFLAFVISLNAFAQNSNLIVFNNGGQQFFVILNGIKQNSIPKTNVKIEGLSPAAYKVKIIFADGKTGDIDKNVYLEPNMEYSAQVVIKNAKKRSLRLFDIVALNTSPYGNGAETVTFRPNEGAGYSDQTSTGSAGTNGSVGGTAGVTSNGQVTHEGNQSTNTTVTTNVSGNGQNGNVQVNVPEPDILVDLNMPMGYSQTSVTNPDGSQTITTTVNGQTTTITTNTTGTGGQVSTNISGTGTGGQTATQTTTTTVNGQTTQVTTNVSGNGHVTGGTHTHADGTVHDHNHNVVTTTTANGQTTTVSAGTHTHADGTVHNANHQVVSNGQVKPSGTHTHTHADGTVHDEHHNPVHVGTTSRQPSGAAIVNPNGTLTCNSAVATIDYLVSGIKEASFSEDQMNLVKTELRSKCINSDQAYRIVNAFTFDGDKIAMSKFCFDHMTDKDNASKLLDLFQFSSSKDELKKYFGK